MPSFFSSLQTNTQHNIPTKQERSKLSANKGNLHQIISIKPEKNSIIKLKDKYTIIISHCSKLPLICVVLFAW